MNDEVTPYIYAQFPEDRTDPRYALIFAYDVGGVILELPTRTPREVAEKVVEMRGNIPGRIPMNWNVPWVRLLQDGIPRGVVPMQTRREISHALPTGLELDIGS